MPSVHFSFDDTIVLFQELTEQAHRGAAFFDNPRLNAFRQLHLRYGLVISLYCFYQDQDGFSLADCTDAYRAEFAANSHWLRFGFHARTAQSRYTDLPDSELATDYGLVLTQLERITGGGAAIDLCPRLHFAAATRAGVEALQQRYGIIGLTGADDSRLEYYLSKKANDELLARRIYTDPSNQLRFVMSETRMERLVGKLTDYLAQAELRQRLDSGVPIAFMSHELYWPSPNQLKAIPALPAMLETLCETLHGLGCRFVFPADVI